MEIDLNKNKNSVAEQLWQEDNRRTTIMPVVDTISRLENESTRFRKEIDQKQRENALLREQIKSMKLQIVESQKVYDEITKVSRDRSIPHL